MVKRLSAMWETCVHSLAQEDPLEKEMATHSSTLAWKISCMEEPGGQCDACPLKLCSILALPCTVKGRMDRLTRENKRKKENCLTSKSQESFTDKAQAPLYIYIQSCFDTGWQIKDKFWKKKLSSSIFSLIKYSQFTEELGKKLTFHVHKSHRLFNILQWNFE